MVQVGEESTAQAPASHPALPHKQLGMGVCKGHPPKEASPLLLPREGQLSSSNGL